MVLVELVIIRFLTVLIKPLANYHGDVEADCTELLFNARYHL